VSPPGGDFSDPVTASTLAIVQVFWGLDKKLAQKKHFPSVNWNISFTKYEKPLKAYYDRHDPNYPRYVAQFGKILQEEKALQEIVQLVGKDSLDEEQKVSLEVAKLIREDFLMQNSFTPYDFTCPPVKTAGMMRNMCRFYDLCMQAVTVESEHKMTWSRIKNTLKTTYDSLVQMKFIVPTIQERDIVSAMNLVYDSMTKAFAEIH